MIFDIPNFSTLSLCPHITLVSVSGLAGYVHSTKLYTYWKDKNR